mgnify:CR=1 FL=1
MTEREREAITTYGAYLFLASSILAHSIIGKSGSTQGAKTVSTQAKNATINKVIIL